MILSPWVAWVDTFTLGSLGWQSVPTTFHIASIRAFCRVIFVTFISQRHHCVSASNPFPSSSSILPLLLILIFIIVTSPVLIINDKKDFCGGQYVDSECTHLVQVSLWPAGFSRVNFSRFASHMRRSAGWGGHFFTRNDDFCARQTDRQTAPILYRYQSCYR